MARHPGLMARGRRWYLRAKVPVDLGGFLGRQEIWRSLGTGDHAAAVKLYRRARADLDAWFDQQRRRRDAGERLNGEAPRLVTQWFHQQERRAAHTDFALSGELLHEALAEVEQDLVDLLAGEAGADVEAVVNAVLLANGWPARAHTVGSISTQRTKVAEAPDEHRAALSGSVRQGLVELARRRRDRLQGRPHVGYDPLFNVAVVQSGAKRDGTDGITLGELIEQFSADKTARLSPGKVTEYHALFRLLRDAWGEHLPVRSISREHCRKIRELVAVLPAHASKRWAGKSLVEVAEHARKHALAPMDPATSNAYLQRLSTMLRWAEREEHLTRNPAVGLRVAQPEGDPRTARLPFSLDQLNRICGGLAVEQPWRRWITLLGLFTGARLNEICQLATADVVRQDGVDVILIRPSAENGARLKTPAAQRVIPVHPELIKIGFLQYVEKVRQGGHDRLFPELRQDSRGRYSDLYQKWFSRFLVKVGAKAPKTSYHSFRHSFTDALRRAGATGDVTDALCGWTRGNMRERYGSGPWLLTLADVIQKVEYALDLSHLYVR
jgi:integrase